MMEDTDVSEEYAASNLAVKMGRYGPPKHWYTTTSLYDVTTYKTTTWIFTIFDRSNLYTENTLHVPIDISTEYSKS
jgi:hypothetical protein